MPEIPSSFGVWQKGYFNGGCIFMALWGRWYGRFLQHCLKFSKNLLLTLMVKRKVVPSYFFLYLDKHWLFCQYQQQKKPRAPRCCHPDVKFSTHTHCLIAPFGCSKGRKSCNWGKKGFEVFELCPNLSGILVKSCFIMQHVMLQDRVWVLLMPSSCV